MTSIPEAACEVDIESADTVDVSGDNAVNESVEDTENIELCKFVNASGLVTPHNELGCRNRCTLK